MPRIDMAHGGREGVLELQECEVRFGETLDIPVRRLRQFLAFMTQCRCSVDDELLRPHQLVFADFEISVFLESETHQIPDMTASYPAAIVSKAITDRFQIPQ